MRTSLHGLSWLTTSTLSCASSAFARTRRSVWTTLSAAQRTDEDRRVPARRELRRHAYGRAPDRRACTCRVGALAWADAVHYAPHGPIDTSTLGLLLVAERVATP